MTVAHPSRAIPPELVTISMPCWKDRWSFATLGVLGNDHTCRFHDPAGTDPASERLFLDVLFQDATLPKAVDWLPVPSCVN